MRRSNIAKTLTVALLLPLGCSGPEEQGDDEEPLGRDVSALCIQNALSYNSLTSNALTSNALTSNALTSNTLSPAALAAIQDPGAEGDRSRAFLRYAVSCAFSASQSFLFSWTDSLGAVHDESYPGLLGIAPSWSTGPLTTTGQKMVSACIVARVNWYGVSVLISVRSLKDPLKTLVGSAERADYANVEGGFWGNLFGPTPYARSCYDDANVARSRGLLRDCATGHINADGTVASCGMIEVVGSCSAHCKALNGAGQYYPECTDPVLGKTDAVVTTALP